MVADSCEQRFVALIRADRASILAAYADRLEELSDVADVTRSGHDHAIASGDEMITEVAAKVEDGGFRTEAAGGTPLTMTPAAERQPNPAELVRATATFFDVTVASLAARVQDDPELLTCFTTAVCALNESISRRLRAAILGHTGYLLERVDQAHIGERRRIARELHDRLGGQMSAALRQLELHEIIADADAAGADSKVADSKVAIAKDALTEAMHRLRIVSSGLREKPVRSLEEALVHYIDSTSADTEVRLQVSGDEHWAPSAVIEEVYLIIREAVRNALDHAAPRLVQIVVALAPHELNAWVDDDGSGFTLTEGGGAPAGIGLSSMRERAAALAGRLTIMSVPGRGTQIELLVPLRGHRYA
jgi:signal transduction histidine kinase